jgi:thiamine biosynthesis protein ThiS
VKIELNGEAREVPDGTTVAALIEALGLRPEVVAVELNQSLVAKARRAEVRLAPGDRIELVTLVGGG